MSTKIVNFLWKVRNPLEDRTYAVDPFSCGLWFVVAQFIALSSGISPQFWHESQFCVSPEKISIAMAIDTEFWMCKGSHWERGTPIGYEFDTEKLWWASEGLVQFISTSLP